MTPCFSLEVKNGGELILLVELHNLYLLFDEAFLELFELHALAAGLGEGGYRLCFSRMDVIWDGWSSMY